MGRLKKQEFVKRGDIRAAGVARYQIEKAILVGSLRPRVFPGMKYAHFLRSEVVACFGLTEEEARRT